jgi:cobalt-zinc-cadmium efflux system outer membrane protein
VSTQAGLLVGNVLTLAEAEKIFIENNLELKAKRSELKKYDAEVIGAGLLPNPTVRYNVESFKNGERTSEEAYYISQSIDIVRKRGLRIDTALKRKNAKYLLYEQDVLDSLSAMKQIYYKIILLKDNASVIERLHEKFIDMENRTAKRFEAGDVSEVELMRLRSERKKLERLISNINLEMVAEQRNLAIVLNLPLEDITLKEELSYEPITIDAKELLSIAMEKRWDIKAATMLVAAANSSLNLEKKETVMPIEIEAGYRKQAGGVNGFVLGVSIPLPLFSRNQDGIASAAAELKSEKIRKELLKKHVLNEIELLLDRKTSLSALIADTSKQVKNAREITSIVYLLFEEGETNLVEMLDAVRSETELSIEYNNLVYEYMATIFEIERTAGVSLIKDGGVK